MVVLPVLIPVTTPAALTDATRGLLLVHTPPVVAFVSAVVVPAQIVVTPVIA